ncbi:MAG: AbrB/MazE/SpoVT family DNA-binding domain-containing protein [Syntrophobacteraceae bacterium]
MNWLRELSFLGALHGELSGFRNLVNPQIQAQRMYIPGQPLTTSQIRAYNVITYYGEDEEMKTRLVRIGNSRGIRLPKPLIAQAGLTDEVELHVRDGAIVIERSSTPRAGWALAAREMHERNEDSLLDSPSATHFDEKEWEW